MIPGRLDPEQARFKDEVDQKYRSVIDIPGGIEQAALERDGDIVRIGVIGGILNNEDGIVEFRIVEKQGPGIDHEGKRCQHQDRKQGIVEPALEGRRGEFPCSFRIFYGWFFHAIKI